MNAIGLDAVERHEHELARYAYERLQEIDGLRILGPSPEHRAGLVSFTRAQPHPHDVAQLLDQQGIAVRAGHHCTQPLHDRLGITASTRASFYLYNTPAEVDLLVDTVRQIQDRFKPQGRHRQKKARLTVAVFFRHGFVVQTLTPARKTPTQPPAGASCSVIVSPAETSLLVDGQMLGIFAAIVGVVPKFQFPLAAVEEIELHGNLAWLAIGHRAEIPIVARSPDHHQVFAHRAVEHACLVPHGRHDLQEFGTGLIAEIWSGCSQMQQTGLS